MCARCSSRVALFPGAGRVCSHVHKLHLVLGAGHSKVLFIQLCAVPSSAGCNWQALFRITLWPVGVVVIKVTVIILCVVYSLEEEGKIGEEVIALKKRSGCAN